MKYSCINSTPNIQHLKSVFVFNLKRLKPFKPLKLYIPLLQHSINTFGIKFVLLFTKHIQMTKEQLKILENNAAALKAEGILTGSPKYINPIRKIKSKKEKVKRL